MVLGIPAAYACIHESDVQHRQGACRFKLVQIMLDYEIAGDIIPMSWWGKGSGPRYVMGKMDHGPFGPAANPLESSVRGSIYEGGCDALHRGYARARALSRCDHEDGHAYLWYGNT